MSQGPPTRVLVVEDDTMTLASIVDTLQDDGAVVTALTSGGEFMALLADAAEAPPQVLVVDVNLGGGMSGFDVARMAHARWPGIAVIYVTGDLRAVVRNVLGPHDLCLLKPFTDEALRRMMRAVPGGVAETSKQG